MDYRRVLLKLSGEALSGDKDFGVDPKVLISITESLKTLQDRHLQIGVVIGGGNIFRGVQRGTFGMERAPADHVGMLATVINGIVIQQALRQIGAPCRVMSALVLFPVNSFHLGEQIFDRSEDWRTKATLVGWRGRNQRYMFTRASAFLRERGLQRS